jgi:hypothetical protein
METDRRIKEAMEAGERTKATIELVRNWCRHARVERPGGGVGLVEMQTGLPIGHHAMACDHAVAGGMASWDLADAAVDFHDRNCVNCAHRVPVGFPNLATLVGERNARQERINEVKRARRDRWVELRAIRRDARQALRTRLPPLSASVVDCVEELDHDAPQDAAERLMGAGKLAPETFTPELIEYLFQQLESGESWFAETGFRLLHQLNADPKRLTDCAVRSLSAHGAVAIAAQIIESNSALIDPAQVAGALPALASVANPERTAFARTLTSDPGPLRAVHRAHGAPLEAAIEQLLNERHPRSVSLAAGAIEVLARTDKAIVTRFTRSLAAKLTGAKWLIDERRAGFLGDDECINRLKNDLVLALRYAPAETDALLGQFLAGARGESEARLYQVYSRALTNRSRHASRAKGSNFATGVALKRLLSGLNCDNQDVLREIQSALSNCADEHTTLARQEFTALLGSAMLLDDQVKRFDAEAPAEQDFLTSLERRNRRDTWRHLQETLLEWAATAAKGSPLHTEQYHQVLNGMPEGRDELRSAFIANAKHFMATPEGLNAMLPTLYTAMVGTSVRLRGAAARALGELSQRGRDDIPELIYEAFTALLSDPYVFVHTAGVEALGHLALPSELDRRCKAALGRWIMVYSANNKDDSFLLDCMRLYWRRYARDPEKGALGSLYVKWLERMKPHAVIRELRWLRRDLRDVEGFTELIVGLLSQPELSEHQAKDVLDALAELSPEAIQRHRVRLTVVASGEATPLLAAIRVVETLTRAGAWQEATQVNEAVYGRIPQTTERHPLRLQANLWRIATRFEEVLSQGRLEEVPELASQWRSTKAEIEEDQAKHAQQRSLVPSFPMAH